MLENPVGRKQRKMEKERKKTYAHQQNKQQKN